MKIYQWVILSFISIQAAAQPVRPPIHSKPILSGNTISYKVIIVANNSFGYDIFDGDHRIIHQTSTPGLSGNQGFRRKQDAEKVASLVVQKLNRHIVPPTVTIHEMDSLAEYTLSQSSQMK